jgi:hypothetical protein
MWIGREPGLGIRQEEALQAAGEPCLEVVGCPSVVDGQQQVQVWVCEC